MDRKVSLLYTGDDFIAHIERCDGFLFVHCEVLKWSTGTLRHIKKGLCELYKGLEDAGYGGPVLTYTQNPRWVKLVGGVYKSDFEYQGSNYELWELR